MSDVDIDGIIESYLQSDDPVPPEEQSFVGDGEFRLIGAEFLRHFVTIGGLQPADRVLDIGCGLGRMALPMRHFLSENGSYHGMNVVRDGIVWCDEMIAARDPRFQFSHMDVVNTLYNPRGTQSVLDFRFPADDDAVDFLVLTSVFTHLTARAYQRYLLEAARVLAPGGRMFATFFIMNDRARDFMAAGASRYAFDLSAPGPTYHIPDQNPLGAVAVDEDWLVNNARFQGLEIDTPFSLGYWPSNNVEDGVSISNP